MTIDLDNLDDSIASLEARIGAVGKHPKGVSADHLSKIWSIDVHYERLNVKIQKNKKRIDVQYEQSNVKIQKNKKRNRR